MTMPGKGASSADWNKWYSEQDAIYEKLKATPSSGDWLLDGVDDELEIVDDIELDNEEPLE